MDVEDRTCSDFSHLKSPTKETRVSDNGFISQGGYFGCGFEIKGWIGSGHD